MSLLPVPFGFSVDEVLCRDRHDVVERERQRARLLWRAIRWADVVHFNFGKTITPEPEVDEDRTAWKRALYGVYKRALWMRDLPILRRAGKSLFVTFQGDDVRQVDGALATYEVTHVAQTPKTDRSDGWKRRSVRLFDRYTDGMFALNPDLLRLLPSRAEFLPYASVDPNEWEPVGPAGNAVPVIVHAPTDREAKGTQHLIDTCRLLGADGIPFELDLVEGVEYAHVRERYERADLVVDQVLAGWYGAFAVEMMALGKPVICYIREDDLTYVPEPMRSEVPVVPSRPDQLHATLRRLLSGDREQLREIGRRSRSFVERWHDPRQIARTTSERYQRALGTSERCAD